MSAAALAGPAPRRGAGVVPPSELSDGQKIFAFAVMGIGFFIALLDIQIVSASLADIGGGLSASPDEVAWVQTSYLIAEIIVIPLSGFLSRVMSTRWLFCVSAAGFTATSLLCGWAWDIQSMIVFRALQGFLGGSMIPTVFTTAFAFFPGRRVVVAAATLGALSSLGPTLGPTVGGWITDNYSWHWLFFVNLVPGVFVAIVVPIMVRIDEPDLSALETADWLGIALMAVFLGCLEYTLEEGPRWNWLEDRTVLTTAWITGISGVGFVWRSLAYAHPVVDLRALKSRNFSLGCFFSFVTGIGIFATIYLTPLFLGRVRGFSALQIGEAVFTTGVFQVMAIPVYMMLSRRVDLGGLAPDRLKLASGLFNLMRNLGGAIGIAGCGTVLNDRANLHFLRIAERLTPANGAMMATVQGMEGRDAGMLGGDPAHAHAAAMKQLWSLAWREAQTMTYADAFLLIAGAFAVATAMVPLMRKVAPPKGPVADAH